MEGQVLQFRNVLVAFLVVCVIAGFSMSSSPLICRELSSQEVVSVIVDMDVAPDDIGALVYLLKHPGVAVQAVTVSCGVAYVDEGVWIVLRLLDYLGVRDIPVAAGKQTPLVGDSAFPTSWRDGCNGVYGLELADTDLPPSELNASELIISIIRSSPENVTLVTTGPLTNIAIALQADPSIKAGIEVIHSMGGAVTVPGNVGYEYPAIPNYVAEWNIWVDPHAADIVFKSGVPITLIPLDATNEVPKNEVFRTRLESVMRTTEAEIVHQFLDPDMGAYFWDQLAVVALTDPSVVTFEWYYLEVLTVSGDQIGWTQSLDQDPPNTKVAIHADAEQFENCFLETINYLEPGPLLTGPLIVALVMVISLGITGGLIILAFYLRRKP